MNISTVNSIPIANPVTDETFKRLASIISTQRAVLFTGSGFSCGANNVSGNEPPRASGLARLICSMGNMDPDDDLTYASDYYLQYGKRSDLLSLLKNTFLISKTEAFHQIIAGFPWRRTYTTNYDDALEVAGKAVGKAFTSISIEDDPSLYQRKNDCCVHLNGFITTASEDDLSSRIKLTRSSYASPDSFVSSPWYYFFKRDVEQCSALVFIGYSLYDIDIERLLFSSSFLKEKTFFVVSKESPRKEQYLLSKYGTVLPIGVNDFAQSIQPYILDSTAPKEFFLDCFEEFHIYENSSKVSDDQILSLILHGKIEPGMIENAALSPQAKPYLVLREGIQEIERLLSANAHVAVISDFGNGKSIVLQLTMARLAIQGKRVFQLINPDGKYIDDIEKLSKLGSSVVLFIDDYTRNLELIHFLSQFHNENISTVIADRTNHHDRFRSELIDKKVNLLEVPFDHLSQKEIQFFIRIIDNLGSWDALAGLSPDRKEAKLLHDYKGRISHILLDLYQSPQMRQRMDSLASPLLSKPQFKETIFAICLLDVLQYPKTTSLVSEVAGNDLIYKSEIRSDQNFAQLFSIGGRGISSKSSLFSISLLNNFFQGTFIIDQLLNLVERLDKISSRYSPHNFLFKDLLRFSCLERILPDKGKLNCLSKYYEELKVRVDWLKHDPHYWLQYGMARMSYGELSKGQSNLDQAYAIALRKGNYDTSFIDTQQGRLFILKSMQECDGNIIWDTFEKGHNLLVKLKDDSYKFKQVILYKTFFDKMFNKLSKKNRTKFFASVKQMLALLDKSGMLIPQAISTRDSIEHCKNSLEEILLATTE